MPPWQLSLMVVGLKSLQVVPFAGSENMFQQSVCSVQYLMGATFLSSNGQKSLICTPFPTQNVSQHVVKLQLYPEYERGL
jgi:hypothetical protein